jgi:hypothetical protein
MSGVDPDRLIKLALAIARRHTEENEELAAAYDEYDARLATASKEDPEFGNALYLAFMLGDIKPLKQYLCSEKPLTRVNRQALAGYIDILVERTTSLKRQRGRPRRNAAKARPAEQAERNAAWLVAAAQKGWRKEHGKARVPGEIFDKFVREAREEAACAFGVPVNTVSEGNVRNYARKTGRIVVP